MTGDSHKRFAVVGSGISGMSTAWLLSQRHDVVLYEAENRLGGHSNTVTVEGPNGPVDVDTGFIVYNERNYPNFVRLLRDWGVATQESDMSFSLTDEATGHEWTGSLGGVVSNPRHWRMFAGIVR